MYKDDALKLMLEKKLIFNNRYNKPFGQIMLRLNDGSYLMSEENLMLSSIREENVKQYKLGSDIFSKVFRKRNDINAIIFICSEMSVDFSNSYKNIYPSLMDLAELAGPSIKIIENAKASSIIKAIKHIDVCIIKNVGVIAVGKDLDSAISAALILEKSIQVEVYGKKLGGVKHLKKNTSTNLHKYYKYSYKSKNKGSAVSFVRSDERENSLRYELIETALELCNRSLIQGTWGNLSVRLNDDEMLITPASMNYKDMKIEDIVKVNLKTLDYSDNDRLPSSETSLHAAIYLKKPECNAIIHTHSVALSVFAASKVGFKLTNPVLNELIGDVKVCDFALPGTDDQINTVNECLSTSNACIMANHGAIFTAKDLKTAFIISDAVETKASVLLEI